MIWLVSKKIENSGVKDNRTRNNSWWKHLQNTITICLREHCGQGSRQNLRARDQRVHCESVSFSNDRCCTQKVKQSRLTK